MNANGWAVKSYWLPAQCISCRDIHPVFCFFNNEKFINVDKTKTPFTKLGCLDTIKNSVETWKDTTTKGKLL
jgi:hypothetical protein